MKKFFNKFQKVVADPWGSYFLIVLALLIIRGCFGAPVREAPVRKVLQLMSYSAFMKGINSETIKNVVIEKDGSRALFDIGNDKGLVNLPKNPAIFDNLLEKEVDVTIDTIRLS